MRAGLRAAFQAGDEWRMVTHIGNDEKLLAVHRVNDVTPHMICIDPLRLSADGVGSDTPIASNDNAAGRQVNRRIEFDLSIEGKGYGPYLFR